MLVHVCSQFGEHYMKVSTHLHAERFKYEVLIIILWLQLEGWVGHR